MNKLQLVENLLPTFWKYVWNEVVLTGRTNGRYWGQCGKGLVVFREEALEPWVRRTPVFVGSRRWWGGRWSKNAMRRKLSEYVLWTYLLIIEDPHGNLCASLNSSQQLNCRNKKQYSFDITACSVCKRESSIVQPKSAEYVYVDVAGNRNWWVCREFVAAAVIVTVQIFLNEYVNILVGEGLMSPPPTIFPYQRCCHLAIFLITAVSVWQ